MAAEIALARAAVLIYDSSSGADLTLEYCKFHRGSRPVVVVDAPSTVTDMETSTSDENLRLQRPTEMTGWPSAFVEPLLSQIQGYSPTPDPNQIAEALTLLESEKRYADLVLTGLALLERLMRTEDLPTTVPINPTETVMSRLNLYFGGDYQTVIRGVSLRHDLLQGPEIDAQTLQEVGVALSNVVRIRYGGPPRG